MHGYEGQNGAYYWCLRGQFDRTKSFSVSSGSMLNPIRSVAASRHLRLATPCGDWLVVSVSYLVEKFPSADLSRTCTALGTILPSSSTISRYALPPYFWSQFERNSQTIAFFVAVLLVSLLLQCVFASSLSCIGSADHFCPLFGTEMGNPITWKVLC